MLADRIGIPQLRDMAGRSERVVTVIELVELERIADLLNQEWVDNKSANSGRYRLQVEAQFADHGRGFPELVCQVSGILPLSCQRCLSLLDWDVALDFRLAIVAAESDLDHVTERFDAVVADEHGFSLVEAVTDELLGSLPLAPTHSDRTQCAVAEQYIQAVPDDDRAARKEQVNRPFANLATLVGRGSKTDDMDSN